MVAQARPTNPTVAADLERSASEMVVQVKSLLTAKAKNEGLDAALATLGKAVNKVKDNAVKLV